MTDGEEEERLIRRILIALDASPHSLAALRAAAELAAHLEAELNGLFVEDINLIRISDLPFTRQVSYYSATLSRVDRAEIEQQLRAQAAYARRALQNTAENRRVRSTFRVARGAIAEELLNAAMESDLIILGKAGWSHSKRLGSTTLVMISQSPRHTLILQHGARLAHPLGVLYDGSENSQRALKVAQRLRRNEAEFIYVIIMAQSVDRARSLQEEAGEWLRQRGVEGRFHWLINPSANILSGIVNTEHLGALIIPTSSDQINQEILIELLNGLEIPSFLVR